MVLAPLISKLLHPFYHQRIFFTDFSIGKGLLLQKTIQYIYLWAVYYYCSIYKMWKTSLWSVVPHVCKRPACHKYTQSLAKSPSSQLCSSRRTDSLRNHASHIQQSLVVTMLVPLPGTMSFYHIHTLFFH